MRHLKIPVCWPPSSDLSFTSILPCNLNTCCHKLWVLDLFADLKKPTFLQAGHLRDNDWWVCWHKLYILYYVKYGTSNTIQSSTSGRWMRLMRQDGSEGSPTMDITFEHMPSSWYFSCYWAGSILSDSHGMIYVAIEIRKCGNYHMLQFLQTIFILPHGCLMFIYMPFTHGLLIVTMCTPCFYLMYTCIYSQL